MPLSEVSILTGCGTTRSSIMRACWKRREWRNSVNWWNWQRSIKGRTNTSERGLRHMVLPLLRLHDVRGERKALRRVSDAVPEAGIAFESWTGLPAKIEQMNNILELKSIKISPEKVQTLAAARRIPKLKEYDLRPEYFETVNHPQDLIEHIAFF